MTDARPLWPTRDASPDAQRAHFAAMLHGLGYDLPGARPCLLALRGVEPWAAETHPTRTAVAEDDTGILLTSSAVRVWAMATHPYQLDSRASPDVDGDGRGDVATILPGRYLMRRISPVVMHVLRADGSEGIPCLRDTHHDGRPTAPGTATAILLHADWRSGKSSIGCQTSREADVRAVCAAGPEVDFVLVDAEALCGTLDAETVARVDALVLATGIEAGREAVGDETRPA